MIVPISEIKIPRNRRRNDDGIAALAASIKDVGLLHPPVVTGDMRLVCGALAAWVRGA
ncbi:MAG: ParB N-terminal domain-containing protein [Verrucomicrobiota bacterium]